MFFAMARQAIRQNSKIWHSSTFRIALAHELIRVSSRDAQHPSWAHLILCSACVRVCLRACAKSCAHTIEFATQQHQQQTNKQNKRFSHFHIVGECSNHL